MDINNFVNYITAPSYTNDPELEAQRNKMAREFDLSLAALHSFVGTQQADHEQPYLERVREEMEREKSAKAYISLEEREKRQLRKAKNRRGKASRKRNSIKRKILQVNWRIQEKEKEIAYLLYQTTSSASPEETSQFGVTHRKKFPSTYDLSSNEEDWNFIILLVIIKSFYY